MYSVKLKPKLQNANLALSLTQSPLTRDLESEGASLHHMLYPASDPTPEALGTAHDARLSREEFEEFYISKMCGRQGQAPVESLEPVEPVEWGHGTASAPLERGREMLHMPGAWAGSVSQAEPKPYPYP